MTYQTSNSLIRLAATRDAVAELADSNLRQDIERVLAGIEVCLEHDQPDLAREGARMVVSTVMTLSNSLSPERVAGVLDGFVADAETTAVALRQGLGFTKNDDAKCDIKPGTPIGSSVCVPKRGSTCYTASSGTGCGGPSGFQFVWDVALKEGQPNADEGDRDLGPQLTSER